MAVQETRQKSFFFEPKIWAIPTIAHRSRARTDPFRLQGSFPRGTDLLFVFLYLPLGIGSFPFLYLLLTHRSFRLHPLTARECKRIHFNGNISTVRFISTTDRRIARATLERARVRAPSYERAAELGTFVSFFFFRLYTKLKHDHNRTTIHDFNLHQ